ncbi:hypothetical protein KEM56_006062, partial [Ascosphaera pollenicola]
MASIGVSGPAKLQAVTTLIHKLTEDLKSTSLSPEERDKALEELKVYAETLEMPTPFSPSKALRLSQNMPSTR